MKLRVPTYAVMSVLALWVADRFFGDTYFAAVSLLTLGSLVIEVVCDTDWRRKPYGWSVACVVAIIVVSVVLLGQLHASKLSL